MTITLSSAMIRVLKLAVLHAIKDHQHFTSQDVDYEVSLDDALDMLLEIENSEPK